MPPKTTSSSPQPKQPSLKLESWLQTRIANIANHPPRYEASWYGPYNALLSHFFPYSRQFLIKPQSKLRPRYNPSTSAGESISIASAGYPVVPATLRPEIFIPDFLVVKATETVHSDKPILLVEVKVGKDDMTWATGKSQLNQYMRRHVETKGTPIHGLLICGDEAEIYRLTQTRTRLARLNVRCSIKDRRVLEFLRDIAVNHW